MFVRWEAMAARIFIDGAAGTTGLEIRERLSGRRGLELVQLSDADRKDPRARARALNESDLVILCLPDEAARDAVGMIGNIAVRVIDASTAHRTAPGWEYGFPELDGAQRAKIAASKRVANPGCYPTGFLALVRPLVDAGIVPQEFPLTVNAVSGYSGGGKSMIEEFEDKASPRHVDTVVRTYALNLAHKHVPEMRLHARLAHAPVFAPSVGRYYRGMIVEVPLQLWALPKRPELADIHGALSERYRGERFVQVAPMTEVPNTLDAEMLAGTNGMTLFVFGDDKTQQARLVAVLDNLGKGAGGAAVQNLNIMLGLPESEGL
jgi:N-acetyl-gamma-glutamyl-phosphate reductase